jgi:hypothetical protein
MADKVSDELLETMEVGQELALRAGREASLQMAKLTQHIGTKEARVEALRAHAVYIGLGLGFMSHLVPLIEGMVNDLKERGIEDGEAQVIRSIFIGKVFKVIEQELENL